MRTLAPPRSHTLVPAKLAMILAVAICLVVLVTLDLTPVQSEAIPSPAVANQAPSLSVSDEILVRFRANSVVTKRKMKVLKVAGRATEIAVQLEPLNTATDFVPGLRLARVPTEERDQAIAALRSRPDVVYAEPNYIWQLNSTTPNDPRFSEQWGLSSAPAPGSPDSCDINADKAWDITTGEASVVIAVIDGGVDVNHQDLTENIYRNPGEIAGNGVDDDGNGFIDDVEGWDFHHNDNRVFDDQPGDDHATHVAGIIGARGNNALGVTGVCWRVSLIFPAQWDPKLGIHVT